ncbi:GntR family transcriptional regulator [Conexibacter sp. CPCC 206217]|uniref:GntR family transcriptional regulator n=1 Tax=Conexibacter sp. CPCC 206217 TaxID=3064574 RepID=UPI002718C676|nr:GntR family transcriptional regulator [Conexibacter sp. CPCC 206217]MDO8211700.1 GntR family transcriptional regulator [Conexibacter sp. CPCC 206217]
MIESGRGTADSPRPARNGTRGPGTRTLVEYASQQLREGILSGALAAGERIHLDGVAEDFGISAIPVREALRTLATEGLVTPLPHRGYTVAPVTIEDLEETYRIRLVLEPLAVQLAVPRLTRADLRFLGEELDLLGRAFRDGHWPDHRTHHRAFHFGIYEKCNSGWLIRFTDMLWVNSERYQRMTTQIQGQLTKRAREHRRILAACRAGDADKAAELMNDHLSSSLDTLKAYLVRHGRIADS